MTKSVLFWVQHLLGSGHLKRALTIADTLANQTCKTCVLSGGRPVGFPISNKINFFQLAPLSVKDASFRPLFNQHGLEASEAYWQQRTDQITKCLMDNQPDLMLIETYPFGRRPFRNEVLKMIRTARSIKADVKLVASIRDVLVQKPLKREREMLEVFHEHFDHCFVHGDERYVDLSSSFSLAHKIEPERISYTGYVTDVLADTYPVYEKRGVVVSVGAGGIAGQNLLHTALELASSAAPFMKPFHIVAGRDLRAEEQELADKLVQQEVYLTGFTTRLRSLIARAGVSVSLAGYNTVAEALALKTPMVLVPFDLENETEQIVRAQALNDKGFAVCLRNHKLSQETLKQAIGQARLIELPDEPVALNGAEQTARKIRELLSL